MASAPVSAANSAGVSSPATAAASPQLGPGHAPTLGPGDEDGDLRYGLLGLLNVLHTSNTDLRTLALGLDLTTLGLDLNPTREMHPSFVSPWTGVRTRTGKGGAWGRLGESAVCNLNSHVVFPLIPRIRHSLDLFFRLQTSSEPGSGVDLPECYKVDKV
jgi:hypothetical protein